MAFLSGLIQLLTAIPKIFELIKGLMDLYKQDQIKKKREEQLKAIEEMKKAKTKEEIKNANKKITQNIP